MEQSGDYDGLMIVDDDYWLIVFDSWNTPSSNQTWLAGK